MATMEIDKLTLRLSGVAGDDARRLAQRIAEELAIAPAPRRPRLGMLQVEVGGSVQGNLDDLAHQVVTEVLRQIARQG